MSVRIVTARPPQSFRERMAESPPVGTGNGVRSGFNGMDRAHGSGQSYLKDGRIGPWPRCGYLRQLGGGRISFHSQSRGETGCLRDLGTGRRAIGRGFADNRRSDLRKLRPQGGADAVRSRPVGCGDCREPAGIDASPFGTGGSACRLAACEVCGAVDRGDDTTVDASGCPDAASAGARSGHP